MIFDFVLFFGKSRPKVCNHEIANSMFLAQPAQKGA